MISKTLAALANAPLQILALDPKGSWDEDSHGRSCPDQFGNWSELCLSCTEKNVRNFTTICLTAKGVRHARAAILTPQMLLGPSSIGVPMLHIVKQARIIPAVTVDENLIELESGALWSTGADGAGPLLDKVLKAASAAGISKLMAKYRTCWTVRVADRNRLLTALNTAALTIFAQECLSRGIVPIVEPDISHAGTHSLQECAENTVRILHTVFETLFSAGIDPRKIIVKTSLVVPGISSSEEPDAGEIACATVDVWRSCIPPVTFGVVALSGGLADGDAEAYANAVSRALRHESVDWHFGTSFGRSSVGAGLAVFKPEDSSTIAPAQHALGERWRRTRFAIEGRLRDFRPERRKT